LGAWLLRDLLRVPELASFQVVCLVRAPTKEAGLKRLLDNFRLYDLALTEEELRRVEIQVGDVAKDLFGLLETEFDSLSSSLVAIVNNAAMVNSVLSYEQLKAPNVLGTQQALKLAFIPSSSSSFPISFFHVSTIGLLSGSGIREELVHDTAKGFTTLSGYAQTKYIAENLVVKALEAGLNGAVFRPGTISGDSASGACNLTDAFVRTLRGLIKDQRCCLGEGTPLLQSFPLIPVDAVSSSIVNVAASYMSSANSVVNKNDRGTRIFHLVGTAPFPLSLLVEGIEASGVSMENLSASDYKSFMATIKEDHPMYAFKNVLAGQGFLSVDDSTLPRDESTQAFIKAHLGVRAFPFRLVEFRLIVRGLGKGRVGQIRFASKRPQGACRLRQQNDGFLPQTLMTSSPLRLVYMLPCRMVSKDLY